MISAKFLWGNVLLGGKLKIGAKNSNFEIFESALYMKSVSMPLNFVSCPIKYPLGALPQKIDVGGTLAVFYRHVYIRASLWWVGRLGF